MKTKYDLISVEEIPHSIEYKVCLQVSRVPSWYNKIFGSKPIESEIKTYIGYSTWREVPNLDPVIMWSPLEDILEDAVDRFEKLREYSKCS